jgi:hypothetical protein
LDSFQWKTWVFMLLWEFLEMIPVEENCLGSYRTIPVEYMKATAVVDILWNDPSGRELLGFYRTIPVEEVNKDAAMDILWDDPSGRQKHWSGYRDSLRWFQWNTSIEAVMKFLLGWI